MTKESCTSGVTKFTGGKDEKMRRGWARGEAKMRLWYRNNADYPVRLNRILTLVRVNFSWKSYVRRL